ncbi:hypothetical protein N509_01033 [Brucella abortus BC95]|nr:hypothetical protein N509_01033 [Brucella abortus BC95]ERT85021.1 hypothetical protein P050_00182 [Brucella abortus 90-12178]
MRAFGDIADRLLNLYCQFTRWRQDQRACGFRAALVAKADDFLKDGQAESRRLAGTRLGDAEDVLAFKL